MSEKDGVETSPPAYATHNEKAVEAGQEPVAPPAGRRASVALNLVENPLKVAIAPNRNLHK